MRTPCTTCALAVALAATAAGAAAQEAVGLGDRVEGTLTEADSTANPGQIARLLPLTAPAGSRLEITLESTDFDAYVALVRLVDGGFVPLAENDDTDGLGSPTDSRIARALGAEEYAVWVGSYDGSGTGTFSLTVSPAAAGAVLPVTIELGARFDGSFDGVDPRTEEGAPFEVLEFSAYAGDRVLALSDGETPVVLTVSSAADPTPLGRALPADGRTLLDFFAGAAGGYRITAHSDTGSEGAFSVRVWSPAPTHAEMAGLVVEGERIEHPDHGISLPSPGTSYYPTRIRANPHGGYSDGLSRAWTLSDGTSQLNVVYFEVLAGLSTETADRMVTDFFGAVMRGAQRVTGGTEDARIKAEPDGNGWSAVLPMGAGSPAQGRCLTSPSDVAPGKLFCVLVVGELPGGAERFTRGMILR